MNEWMNTINQSSFANSKNGVTQIILYYYIKENVKCNIPGYTYQNMLKVKGSDISNLPW